MSPAVRQVVVMVINEARVFGRRYQFSGADYVKEFPFCYVPHVDFRTSILPTGYALTLRDLHKWKYFTLYSLRCFTRVELCLRQTTCAKKMVVDTKLEIKNGKVRYLDI